LTNAHWWLHLEKNTKRELNRREAFEQVEYRYAFCGDFLGKGIVSEP
jgi:hypothetical protein